MWLVDGVEVVLVFVGTSVREWYTDSVQWCTRVYKGVQGCTRVYKGVQGCTNNVEMVFSGVH